MGTLRALIVDDSKVMRLMVIRALRQSKLAEFECDEAQDGEDGLEKIKAGDYRIVFADINMPRLSGLEMVRQVREAGFDDLRIVMITSEKTSAKVNEAKNEAGADAYIAKPFSVETLQRELSELIAGLEEGPPAKRGLFSRLVTS